MIIDKAQRKLVRQNSWADGIGGIFLKHVLSVLVKNRTGVLVRVASMFSRRGSDDEAAGKAAGG